MSRPNADSKHGFASGWQRYASATRRSKAKIATNKTCDASARLPRMLDINLLRNDIAAVSAGLARRGVTLDVARFEALEGERKVIQTRTQELQARRNALSKQIGVAKGRGDDASSLLAEVGGLSAELER